MYNVWPSPVIAKPLGRSGRGKLPVLVNVAVSKMARRSSPCTDT